jgi:RNA polymerase sigma-70 factor (ECF subfamily)
LSLFKADKEKSNFEDLQLLGKISAGDRNSFAAIYDKYQQPIYSLIIRIVRDEEEAVELLQNVFLQIWEKAALFDYDRGSFKSWLFTLAHNRSIDALHSHRYKKTVSEIQREIAEIKKNLEKNNDQIVLAELRQMHKFQYKVLFLSYFEGYSRMEIAEILSLPFEEVKILMRQGMKKLQELSGTN